MKRDKTWWRRLIDRIEGERYFIDKEFDDTTEIELYELAKFKQRANDDDE